jgi:hypothetical protein
VSTAPAVGFYLSDITESGEVLDVNELVGVNRRFPLSNECNGTIHCIPGQPRRPQFFFAAFAEIPFRIAVRSSSTSG